MSVKTMSSNDAKQNWGSVMRAAREDDIVVVESHGKPQVFVASYDDYEAFNAFKAEQRRKEMLRRLDAFEARWSGRNDDLTEEEVEAIAVRAGREINRDAANRHRARFATDRSE